MKTQDFFTVLWQNYTSTTPLALRVEQLFSERGEKVVNDHVAFRTFDRCSFDLKAFSSALESLGYRPFDEYTFPDKYLDAIAFKHKDEGHPKVFASEIRREALSLENQEVLERIISECPLNSLTPNELFSGRQWSPISLQEYDKLSAESEYAAWLSVMGLTANHFTVSVNHLTQFQSIESVNEMLIENGVELNNVGGLVKGAPEVYLEQSSTVADRREERFSCGATVKVPTCFYEFALRYYLPSGDRFEGFVTQNASRIFDSTHRSELNMDTRVKNYSR